MPAGKHKPPVGDRYSGEPHVFVSADTRQKASFVNIEVEVKDPPSFGGVNIEDPDTSGVNIGAKRKTLRGITNHEHL